MIKSPEIGLTPSFPGDFIQPKQRNSDQGDLFRSRLDQFLNRQHPLFKLANSIDWSVFEREFGSLYAVNVGRPGLPIRLMVALHYLKHAFNVSDEAVVAQFIENGYWQYFCGFDYFQHEFPLDPTSLVKWRQRIGDKGMEKLLKVTIETAKAKKYVTEEHLERVNVDTTVQEKAIAYWDQAVFPEASYPATTLSYPLAGLLRNGGRNRIGMLAGFPLERWLLSRNRGRIHPEYALRP